MQFQQLREKSDIKGIMACLLENFKKNIFGIGQVEMYNSCYNGTKLNIELYQNELI